MVKSKVINLENGYSVIIEVLNARKIRVNPLNKGVEVRENENLVGLNYNEFFKAEIDKIIKIDRNPYKIKTITKIEEEAQGPGYYLETHIINKSSIFIFPLLAPNGTTREHFRWEKNFCNCFIGTQADADYAEHIYLLYRFDGSKDFISFEKDFITKLSGFNEIMYVDPYHVLYKFTPDKMIAADYMLIVNSKYSKISEISKTRILNFSGSHRNRPLGQILYKDPKRKEQLEKDLKLDIAIPANQELYDPFNVDEEVYLDKYKIPKEGKNESGKPVYW